MSARISVALLHTANPVKRRFTLTGPIIVMAFIFYRQNQTKRRCETFALIESFHNSVNFVVFSFVILFFFYIIFRVSFIFGFFVNLKFDSPKILNAQEFWHSRTFQFSEAGSSIDSEHSGRRNYWPELLHLLFSLVFPFLV